MVYLQTLDLLANAQKSGSQFKKQNSYTSEQHVSKRSLERFLLIEKWPRRHKRDTKGMQVGLNISDGTLLRLRLLLGLIN